MSRAHSLESRGMTAEGKFAQINHFPFTPKFTNTLTKSSPCFGALSHHSFFSRHNPHPHRMRHIQGFTGRPICMVRDDWCVTSSLFPHPLLKSHINRKAAEPAFQLAQNLYGVCGDKTKSEDFILEKCIHVLQEQPEEKFVRRKTQYSAQTGRLIPPSSKSYLRKSQYQRMSHPQPFHDQELMVLEILCQILQTDSLSTVQQWLLLSGQREKDLVMGMIRQALDGVDLSVRNFQQLQAFHPGASLSVYAASFEQPWGKPHRRSSHQVNQTAIDEKPERIGDAEVLAVHSEAESVQVPSLQEGDNA
ncbi:protein TBATA [Pundamilia nyererei]|uniref:Protein TBATA n=1 Tax=Pundamilia nyererei TaxID=303518 RepID=A0A9Y6M9K4_9CICH|nr:PREDICTED: protein TBATA [Pundamilia nyererei]